MSMANYSGGGGFQQGAGQGMGQGGMNPMLMQLMQMLQGGGQGGQGGQQNGMNYFNPQGGSGPYQSQQGLMGGSRPMAGGSLGSGMGGGDSSDSGWGGIASGIFNMFGSQDPSAAGDKYLSGIESGMGKYLNPYIQSGMRAMPQLEGQYNQLINDPSGVMNRIGAGFQQSPGFQFQTDQATGAANRAAAAGGMAGTPQEQQQLASTVNGLAQQDYGNYMNRGMNMYGQGLNGLSHMNDMGFNASNQMSQGFLQQILAQAQNAAMGAANSNSMMGGGIGSLMGGLSSLGFL